MFSTTKHVRIWVLLSAFIGVVQFKDAWPAETSPGQANITVHAASLTGKIVPRNLTGKFCEHLGNNIYNGMDAQILRNPTFADYPFWGGQMNIDGITMFLSDRERIESDLRRQALRSGWPEDEMLELFAARNDGLACFWSRAGKKEDILVSPDTGPHGGRAQRIEIKSAGGIKQSCWLPLHRVRKYEFEIFARSPGLRSLRLIAYQKGIEQPCAQASVSGLATDWKRLKGSFTVPDASAANVPYRIEIVSDTAGQLLLGHIFLRPADHVNGADPDVIRMLKESRLPLLRWPGGNFVSAYHWEDGVGPMEMRPTKPNYAWGGVEPNTFGTDEFIAFCSAVGCEPMICINGGTGTPEETARWIEYCNGPTSSPMGRRRAANGHSKSFNVRHWEVGNELWGHWQAHWTTASGYAERYLRFANAMLKSDPKIHLYACGAPVLWGKNWNDTLIAETAPHLGSITDHPLIGGNVPRSTEPMDVFRDFMLVPDILERKWSGLREDMLRGGVKEPRLAVTELQMFAHLGTAAEANETERLKGENLVNPGTLGEAIYDTLIYHVAVRLQPFVELVTHSATVNHGGGLRKERERVYANPCHYANAMFSAFNGARIVKCDVQAASETAPIVLPDIRNANSGTTFKTVSAVAATDANKALLISIVNRGTAGPIEAKINFDGFQPGGTASITTLTGPEPWAVNTLDMPEQIHSVQSAKAITDGAMSLTLPACSVVQIKASRR